MRSEPRSAQGRGATPPCGAGTESGFTLVEVLVAVALLSTVMGALMPFLVTSTRVVSRQADRQTAVMLADGAIEQVRAIDLPPPGEPLQLPTATSSTLDGITYTVTLTQATCGRPAAPGGDCDAVASDDVVYYRVIAAVTWPDHRCPQDSCTYQTATLVNTDADLLFDAT